MKSINVPARDPGARLRVRADGTSLERADGSPFFWLGDTAWLINARLSTDEMIEYLDDRAAKGFTVIQVMVVHSIEVANAYGDRAIPESFAATVRSGRLESGAARPGLGYWDTLDFLVDAAADRGIYAALVTVWGSVVEHGGLLPLDAREYARLLALRYRDRANVIWLNGGDLRGSRGRDVWEAIGSTLKEFDPGHLVTFHPFGRTRSATWFHESPWLDFNMFQSGHRDYGQRTPETEVPGEDLWRGEDNWRYVLDDIALSPRKPTLDGEPSYEAIPHGLHDFALPKWTDSDCRRYAYWSLLAGAFGHTYGHNTIMQFHRGGEAQGAYGDTGDWREAMGDPGARQMTEVRRLMEAMPALPLVFSPDALASDGGERYAKRLAARSKGTVVAYAYSGGTIELAAGAVAAGGRAQAWRYDPRTGDVEDLGTFSASEPRSFRAPGSEEAGNDWLLITEPEGAAAPFDSRMKMRKEEGEK